MKPGRWYQNEGSVPFLVLRVEFGRGARSAQVRGILVTRDGVVMENVRTVATARRMREIAAPEGEAYREAERRYREAVA